MVAIEKYIIAQLQDPTDDIFELLRGLSLSMIASRHSCVNRRRYHDEALTIPAIRLELHEEHKKPLDGNYRDCSQTALNLLEATFGIALTGNIFSNPFPGWIITSISK